MAALTERESHWLRVLLDDREILNNMEKSIESQKAEGKKVCPEEQRMFKLTQKFVTFLDMIIKYDNLIGGSPGEVSKRLIRIYASIPTGELDHMKRDYVIFNGLYLAADVMFLDPAACKEYYKYPSSAAKVKCGIPDEILDHTIKFLKIDGKNMAVALLKSDILSTHVVYNSKWDYPIF